jgi:hypothetical protein
MNLKYVCKHVAYIKPGRLLFLVIGKTFRPPARIGMLLEQYPPSQTTNPLKQVRAEDDALLVFRYCIRVNALRIGFLISRACELVEGGRC